MVLRLKPQKSLSRGTVLQLGFANFLFLVMFATAMASLTIFTENGHSSLRKTSSGFILS